MFVYFFIYYVKKYFIKMSLMNSMIIGKNNIKIDLYLSCKWMYKLIV